MRLTQGDTDLPNDVPHDELMRLANHVRGPSGEYHYARPVEGDDDAPLRPCNYPISLDPELRVSLKQCDSHEQARAVCAMKACQIHQTGWAGKRRADEFEREWARLVHLGEIARQRLDHVEGNCWSCEQNPCRCLA